MPIKPENRGRYPKNWRDIVAQVRLRSGDRCEGSPKFPDCRRPNGSFLNKTTGEVSTDPAVVETWTLIDGDRVVRIVLTTGHLDHIPENCGLDNLRHWCQRCHLVYDAEHHAKNARQTRRNRLNNGELFSDVAP